MSIGEALKGGVFGIEVFFVVFQIVLVTRRGWGLWVLSGSGLGGGFRVRAREGFGLKVVGLGCTRGLGCEG